MHWCDNERESGPPHFAPFFTITLSAMECGPGSGWRKHKRIMARQIVARLCCECLRTGVISIQGVKTISLEAQEAANG